MKPIPEIIDEIAQQTRGRCESVESAIHPGSTTELEAERLFGALFAGDASFLVPASDGRRNWVSWIEDVPPYLSLLVHDHIVIDLIACKTDEQFRRKYGCSVSQFVELLERHGDRISINIRDGADSYAAAESTMRPILERASTAGPRFYRLAPIRESAFRTLGVELRQHEEEAKVICDSYEKSV
jgi:hypothetical protein